MSEEDTIEERQENELEVLKSIYGDDLTDLRKKTRKWIPLHLSITLLPLQGSCGLQVHAKVDLHIICTENYPNVVPKIGLEKSQGLSNSSLSRLHQELDEKAKLLRGEVMIFELAEHVKAFLHSHNTPGTESFYEEMLKRQKQKEELDRQAKQKENDLEKQMIIKELQQREEILKKEEMRLRKEHRHNSESFNDDSFNSSGRNSYGANTSSGHNSDDCNHRGSILLDFFTNNSRQIRRGRCISHSQDNCVTFNAMDVDTGELFTISEWTTFLRSFSR
ncbi:RWD domain [Popillia japonica]|uniref:RWD domain n=1 Tax=Popillia japonica TaxID=7064 RepID=A0AAW1IWI3_POPJA